MVNIKRPDTWRKHYEYKLYMYHVILWNRKNKFHCNQIKMNTKFRVWIKEILYLYDVVWHSYYSLTTLSRIADQPARWRVQSKIISYLKIVYKSDCKDKQFAADN